MTHVTQAAPGWLGRPLAMLFAMLMAACTGLPQRPTLAPETALQDTGDTVLARGLAPTLAEHPGQSVFYPLLAGTDALAMRIALARTAQRSLDIQYYIFDADNTGLTLLAEIMAAADRGVRVRVLLDDIHTGGQDKALSAVDAHPNVEVRLFNPFASRGLRLFEYVTDFRRIDRRMHNKSMTADNQLTIVGGRNIGDQYYGAADTDFTDLDLLAGGPVVPQVSGVFDDFWNSEAVYPLSALATPLSGAEAATQQQKLRTYLDEHAVAMRATPYGKSVLETGIVQLIRENRLTAYRGQATVIADRAAKVLHPPEDDSTHAIPQLVRFLEGAQHDLTLISPYFVPPKSAMTWLIGMQQRGVQVRILTNSYGATDVTAVHAGYAPKRRALLKAGVILYELKPTAYAELAKEKKRHGPGGSSRASLHAKTYMVDRHQLFIGSLNLDPRSARLNTEMGIVVDSRELCDMLGQGVDDALLDAAYQVVLADDGESLQWVTREGGVLRTYDREPDMNAWDKFKQGVLRILPVEEEL
ncbi:phospholipase D family protein [Cupriavidus pauculus]|uniref:Phospholipase D family protein n=1 Tax=Cupriavidus pauculus TaxID=82633 RepID=A0A3G8H4U1_9BURK|nr:phospholipase D family protein [Cupriavidus pauculus]AZG14542.1 phospholipase D family protein [Cupriavidus pauculus]